MEQIIDLLFLIKGAPQFISIAGSSWGIDVASTGSLINLFNLCLYILILVVLAPVFWKIRTVNKKFLLILFSGFALGALSKVIDWIVNILVATSGRALWNTNVDIVIEALELLAIIIIIIGLSFITYSHYADSSTTKHTNS